MSYPLTFESEPFRFEAQQQSTGRCQCHQCRTAQPEHDEFESEFESPPRFVAQFPESLEEEEEVNPLPVRSNFVTCNNPNAATAAITGANPVDTIRRASARAVELLDNAIAQLTATRRRIVGGAVVGSPAIGDALEQAVQNRFRLDPNVRATWTGTGARSVHILIRRFQGARQILADGWMNYTCLGDPTVTLGRCLRTAGNGCPADRPDRRAVSCGGHSRIVLCRAWWSDTLDDQASTLLHEAFHIYFEFIGDAGVFGNAHCYEHLVLDLNGLPIQAGFEDRCG